VRGDDPDLASYLQIEERELEAGSIPASTTREAELAAKSTLPVPPDEPADEACSATSTKDECLTRK
jgi:hypothetical protein